MAMLDLEDVHHSAGHSCFSVLRCDSTAICSMRKVKRRSVVWWRSAVWRVCKSDEETLLVNNRQMMCVIGLMVHSKRIIVTIRHLLLLFVDKRRCVLENQNTLSSEALMSDLASIGDYELLEKQNEGYEQGSKQLTIESGLTSTKHVIELRV